MQIPLAFSDLTVIEEVSIPLWQELFDEIGWPESLCDKGSALTHDAILAAIEMDTPSDELLQALEALHGLGTSKGREVISAYIADRQVPYEELLQDLGEREFALRLFLAQRKNKALAEVYLRVQVEIQEGDHRRFDDYTGKGSGHIKKLSIKRQKLEQEIIRYCQEKDLGDHVQLRFLDDGDGVYYFQIIHSYRTKTPLAVTKGSKGRAKIAFRPVHEDLVRYEPELARLRIIARAASMIDFYRKVFGRIFFEDETFFYGEDVCSLDVLREKGRSALENHHVSGVGRIKMTECVWESGDKERLNLRSKDDCFSYIEKLNISLSEGRFIQAKFRVDVIEKSSRPTTVVVRVPSRIEISKDKHEALINRVLEDIGIRNAPQKYQERDIWSLYPWRQPVGVWRDFFGADTDTFVQQGILKPVRLEAVESSAHPGAGRVLQVEEISPTEFIGVSQMPEIPSRSLSATDLDGLELFVPAFQRYLCGVFGLESNVASWAADNWFLDLGVLSIGELQCRIFYALRQPPNNAVESINGISKGMNTALLLPKSLESSTGLTEILLDNALPDRKRVVREIIFSFNFENAPALLKAPSNARLIVDANLGKVWFDNVEIPGLVPGTHAFGFVEMLAKNPSTPLNMHDIVAQLSPGRNDETQAARSAKREAKNLIEVAMKTRGMNFEDPFKAHGGSYRLTVPAYCSGTSTSSTAVSA